jgi:carbonic anhydrase
MRKTPAMTALALFAAIAPAVFGDAPAAGATAAAAPHVAGAAAPARATSHVAAGRESPSPQAARAAATVALSQLMSGNQRFVSGQPVHPRQGGAMRRELAAGQKPGAIVLGCADSRVPPEIVFDHGLGDLFVVRVAGNTLDAATVASIEYALEHLGAPLIVVLGHHSCGAVRAALTTEPKAADAPDLQRLLETIAPAVRPHAAAVARDPTLDRAVRANVDAVLAALERRSAIVRERAHAGIVTLVPAVYRLDSGQVEFWDAAAPHAGGTAGH